MAPLSQFRCAVGGPEALRRLIDLPLPLGLKATGAERSFHRDLFLDTPENSLGSRGASCRLRIRADDTRVLTLLLAGGADRPPERWEAVVPELDPRRALEGVTEPARRLRGLVDPSLLRPRIELETERWTRLVETGWFRRASRFAFLYDTCTVRQSGLVRTFQEIQVRRLAPGGPHLNEIAVALEQSDGLRPLVMTPSERALGLLRELAAEATTRQVSSQRGIVLFAFDGDSVAFVADGDGLRLPAEQGSGEEACRHLLTGLVGSAVGDLKQLGQTAGFGEWPLLEVWVARKIRTRDQAGHREVTWLPLRSALEQVGTPAFRSAETLGALALAARSELDAEVEKPVTRSAGGPRAPETPRRAAAEHDRDRFLNVELSQLAFNERVLEMAEDPTAPLAERLRYLAIVASNADEFFSVRVGALKLAAVNGGEAGFDGLTPAEQLEMIAARGPGLAERQIRAAAQCLAAAHGQGIRLRTWNELDPVTRSELTRHFQQELFPLLTPRAVSQSPGHPFPIIPHGTLAFAVLVRDVHTGPVHFAYLAIPARLSRFVPVPGSADLILLEDVVRANLQAFYPERPVEEAWLFRVTRGAELDVSDEDAGDLLQAIEEEVRRRPQNAPVRLELERGMPALLRDMLMRELRFERTGSPVTLSSGDLYEIDGWLDLTCLRDLAGRLPAADNYPPFQPADPFAGTDSLFRLIDEGDRLVHHPFEDFRPTVVRFLEEAAADPDVAAIKMTLYRTGERSPVVDALVAAAERGKDVSLFVELKARFDEAHNAKWVKRLEEAGAQVVYGLVGLKIHAKIALVIRQTPTGVRRYAHVATGNYNAATARFYTDLGLFTSDPDITSDLGDIFNQLTGSTSTPGGKSRRLLVSPLGTIPGFLSRIDREIEHAAAGRPAGIRIQINGLEDPELIRAFYRASVAGVPVDRVVRGLCLLRPGVPGLSDRIRVRSVLGRFLEHQRIFHFRNGGLDDYLIGSADLRPRNLRRRVEVIGPVTRRDLKARLSGILDRLLAEPAGWDLGPDGRYRRPAPVAGHRHAHELLIDDAGGTRSGV